MTTISRIWRQQSQPKYLSGNCGGREGGKDERREIMQFCLGTFSALLVSLFPPCRFSFVSSCFLPFLHEINLRCFYGKLIWLPRQSKLIVSKENGKNVRHERNRFLFLFFPTYFAWERRGEEWLCKLNHYPKRFSQTTSWRAKVRAKLIKFTLLTADLSPFCRFAISMLERGNKSFEEWKFSVATEITYSLNDAFI